MLILSALGEVDDRVHGLRAGGDDSLVKPCACSELLARPEALLRRESERHRAGRGRADRLLNTFNAVLRIARVEARHGDEPFTAIAMDDLVRDVAELYDPHMDDMTVCRLNHRRQPERMQHAQAAR